MQGCFCLGHRSLPVYNNFFSKTVLYCTLCTDKVSSSLAYIARSVLINGLSHIFVFIHSLINGLFLFWIVRCVTTQRFVFFTLKRSKQQSSGSTETNPQMSHLRGSTHPSVSPSNESLTIFITSWKCAMLSFRLHLGRHGSGEINVQSMVFLILVIHIQCCSCYYRHDDLGCQIV